MRNDLKDFLKGLGLVLASIVVLISTLCVVGHYFPVGYKQRIVVACVDGDSDACDALTKDSRVLLEK